MASCLECPAGTASSTRGAVANTTCYACVGAGAYAPAGSAECATCPAGSFPDRARASCLVGVFSCADGLAPTSATAAECAPLECAPPLLLPPTGARSACAGCPAGFSGTLPRCTPCGAGGGGGNATAFLCPGLTAAPLLSFVSAAAAATVAPACAPLTGPLRVVAAPAAAPPRAASPYTWLTGILTVDEAILTGIALASLVTGALALARAAAAAPAASARAGAARVLGALAGLDALSPADRVAEGRVLKNQRDVGGTFTVLSGVSFATLALVLILQREANNVVSTSSVGLLSDAVAAAAAVLPAAAAPPWGAGLHVRVTAACDAGALAAPLLWSGAPAAWALERVTPACGGAGGAAQLVFRCAGCTLTAASSLTVALPYSCQSLLVEAGSLDAAGGVAAFALPPAETAAPSGRVLESIKWTLPTLLAVLNSSVPSASSARGFVVTNGAHAVATAPLAAGAPGAAAVIPRTANVTLALFFPLQTIFAHTVLSQRQSVTELLSSIVGLAGVFGLFATLLGAYDGAAAALTARRGEGGKAAALTRAPTAKGAADAAVNVTQVNLLRAGALPGAPAAVVASAPAPAPVRATTPARPRAPTPPAPPGWEARFSNSAQDFYYVCIATGETTWDTPAGAAAAGDKVPLEAAPTCAAPATTPLWRAVREGADTWYEADDGSSAWELPAGARLAGAPL